MILILTLLSASPAISTDLYLPALPRVMETLQTSQSLVNLSLSLFFLVFAFSILIWGPISEKYGRKPILLIGLILYTLGSIGCALSADVTLLIASRVIQAIGGGAAQSVSTAMVKDMYGGRKRESVLAVIMAMVVVAPIVAPIIGAFILKFASWYAVFWVLAAVGLLSLLLCLFVGETLEERYDGSLLHSLGRLVVVMKNPGFSTLLGIFALAPIPLFAFIGASAFIYIQSFGMSEEMYSYFFGFNAVGALIGPLLYLRISRYISAERIIAWCFGLVTVSGFVILFIGSGSAVIFALAMFLATLAASMARPPTTNLLLSQQDGDTGSAASLINFMALFMGSLGMILIAQETPGLIKNLGLMLIVVGALSGFLWQIVRGRTFIRQMT